MGRRVHYITRSSHERIVCADKQPSYLISHSPTVQKAPEHIQRNCMRRAHKYLVVPGVCMTSRVPLGKLLCIVSSNKAVHMQSGEVWRPHCAAYTRRIQSGRVAEERACCRLAAVTATPAANPCTHATGNVPLPRHRLGLKLGVIDMCSDAHREKLH